MKLILGLYFTLFSVAASALDASDVDLIDRFSIVRSKVQIHEDGEWGIDAAKMDQDDYEYGQDEFKDLTNWKEVDTIAWFDLKEWEKSRFTKDKSPHWRTQLRNQRNSEVMGRVLKCIGICRYYHDIKGIKAHYQTVLREGDEFMTEQNSYAWISLIDGTLIRVSPKTSLTLQEVNLTPTKTFFLMRLNHGFINTQSRLAGEFETLDRPETDLGFYPLMMKEANREYYTMLEYRGFDDVDKLVYSVADNPGHVLQYKRLNDLMKENNEKIKHIESHLMLFTPNATINAINAHLSIYYAVNGNTHLKMSKSIPHFKPIENGAAMTQKVLLTLRGYEKNEPQELVDNEWYDVSVDGQTVETNENLKNLYSASEGFSKRVPTIQLARELLFQKHSVKLFSPDTTREHLARYHLYYFWDNEKEVTQRSDFLEEYIRRVETTNLKNLSKVFKDVPVENFDKTFYAKAMEKHYFALRMQNTENFRIVRELTDNEYYLWLLRNAKE